MAPDDSSSSPTSASTEGESHTHQSYSSQSQLPYFPRMLLLLLVPPPPPPPPSTANSIPGWRTTMPRSRKPMAMAETCHILQPLGIEQDSHTGQDLSQALIDRVSVFLPDHVPRTITQTLLQFDDNNSDSCLSSVSVCSNDEEAGPEVNHARQPKRVMFTRVPARDDDPDYSIWVGPPPGYFKLNVAVRLCHVEGAYAFGMGAVIRDHAGAARGAMTLLIYDIRRAQAQSFIYNLGIAFSLYWSYKSLIAETESHSLVEHFRALAQTPGLELENFNYFHARPVRRSANAVAHGFARRAPLRRRNIFWTVQYIRNVFGTNVMHY